MRIINIPNIVVVFMRVYIYTLLPNAATCWLLYYLTTLAVVLNNFPKIYGNEFSLSKAAVVVACTLVRRGARGTLTFAFKSLEAF